MAEDSEQPVFNISIDQENMAGVYANFAAVGHSPYEFTLDFVRIDYSQPQPHPGIVVARISLAPLFVQQLIDALTDNWGKFAEKSLPPEVYRNDDEVKGEPEGPATASS